MTLAAAARSPWVLLARPNCHRVKRQRSAVALHATSNDLDAPTLAPTLASTAAGRRAAAATACPAAALPKAPSLTASPEDYQLRPGELGYVNRTRALAPADVFCCSSCTMRQCSVGQARHIKFCPMCNRVNE